MWQRVDELARDLLQRGQHPEACDPENVRAQGMGTLWKPSVWPGFPRMLMDPA